MGYAIKDIAEIDIFDFSTTNGAKATVRKSVDGSKFLIEGELISDYNLSEILEIMHTSEWSEL